jgi:hypothetical protein
MSTELFIEQSMQFHSRNIDKNQLSISNINQLSVLKFGVVSFKAISAPLTNLEQDFIFQIDCSGSMSDICEDGRTKMQHITHTLKNMILYFKENTSLKVYITIHAFDDIIYNIISRTLVNNTTYDEIISAINNIKPRGCTNIEHALNDSKNYIEKINVEYPDTIKTHIFMTDGQATAGSQNNNKLQELVDQTYTNIFIGFGLDHDAKLLNIISRGIKNNYYFIDKLENSGLVYGEILHGIVYKFLENVEISIENGFIYDYNTDTWNTKLVIGDISSESTKFYHIVSNTIYSNVKMTGKKIDDGKKFIMYFHLQEEEVDLTKYIYRQRTQQMLYRINDYNNVEKYDDIIIEDLEANTNTSYENNFNKIKSEIQQLFEELKQYMTNNNLKDDILLKNLCDDIYICNRTLGTNLGTMFSIARGNSQGQQRSYNANYIPNNQNNPNNQNLHRIHRTTNRVNNYNNYYNNYDDDMEIEHELLDSTHTPYRTQTMTQVMRSVSDGIVNIDDLENTQVLY